MYISAVDLGLLFGVLLSTLALPALIFTSVGNSSASSKDFYALQNMPSIQVVVPSSLGVMLCLVVVLCTAALWMMVRVVSRPSMTQVLRLNED